LDKRLCAQTNDGPPPRALHFTNLDAELTWIAEDIAKRLERGEDPAGIAVLARRNSGVQKMHEALESKGIAHAVTGLGNDIYEQPAVRQLIEALKAVNDPLDDVALFHTLSGPLFSIEATQLALLAAAARREHLPLRDMVHNTENERANAALGQLEIWRSQSAEQTVGSLAYAMITDSGWKHTLSSEADSDTELLTQVQALSKFFKTLKEFERISGVGSLQSYIANLPTLRTSGTSFEDVSLDISPTQVNVLSVHRAKGLEWDTVYIIDCTEGSFPLRVFGSNLAIPDTLRTSHTLADEHMAEERRLMYVAVTRARHELILTHANQHGSGSRRAPSRFLHELLGEYTGDAAQTQQDSTEQLNLELFAPRTARDSDAPTIQLPPDMAQDGHFILSVSQIACWLRCPKDFYYTYVLQVPLPPNPALQYGTAIHGAIEAIHTGRREGTPPTLQQLLEQVETALPTAGYLSKRSRERAHDRARQTVEAIYERFSSAPLPIKVETSFSIAMPDMPLKIIGRMDAVYALENGVEIRDFKTGTSVTTPDKAKQRATGSNQLTLYALAWQLMHDEMPALLTLDFVETGQIGTVRKQPKSLATLSAKLQDMVAHLQAGEYPEGKDHTFCHHEQ
ncbi:MAG TPA: ATP-dependent DNA helicase, partial [Candidatus Saccharimonadales bacterium]